MKRFTLFFGELVENPSGEYVSHSEAELMIRRLEGDVAKLAGEYQKAAKELFRLQYANTRGER
jgi:hypothetical protein